MQFACQLSEPGKFGVLARIALADCVIGDAVDSPLAEKSGDFAGAGRLRQA